MPHGLPHGLPMRSNFAGFAPKNFHARFSACYNLVSSTAKTERSIVQPIQVTLSFANAAEMVAYFQGTSLLPVPQGPETKKPASAASGQRTAKATAAPESTASAPAPTAQSAETAAPASTAATAPQETAADPKPVGTPQTASPTASAASSTQPVEYPVLQKAVFTLAGKSREAAAAVAASMGVKTFKELDAARWGEALAAVNAKIAELG